MRILHPTDSGWVEIDALVALLIIVIAVASISAAVGAVGRVSKEILEGAFAVLRTETENAERIISSACR